MPAGNKLNTCDYREKITDLLVIKYGEIQEYIADVVVDIGDKERNFVFSKNNNNYSITFNNGSIEDFTSSYFLANEQVEFIKKIEQKQKKLSRTIK